MTITAKLPDGVPVYFVGVCGYCEEPVDGHRQGHDHEVPESAEPGVPDGERSKVRVVASSVEMVKRSDVPAFIAQDREHVANVLRREAARSSGDQNRSQALVDAADLVQSLEVQ